MLPAASTLAKSHKVPVLLHNVIYKLIDSIKEKLSERLLPLDVEEQMGQLFCMKASYYLSHFYSM